MSLEIIRADSASPELNRVLCDYVSLKCGAEIDFGPCSTLATVKAGKIVGAIVFHDWRPQYGTVEITGGSESARWCGRRVVREIYRTCFEMLKANQIVARCAADNAVTTRIFTALGFEAVLIPNMRGPERHEILFYQTREMWANKRFLR